MKKFVSKTLAAATCAVAFGMTADATVITIGTDKSDISLGSSWVGGNAPGKDDIAKFSVDGFYGPFTMSANMTLQRLSSGGWYRFCPGAGKAAQVFDLKGYTMTLTGKNANDSYTFCPCWDGPGNHSVFSNGTIKIENSGAVTIGPDSWHSSNLRLSNVKLTVPTLFISAYALQNYNNEVRLENGAELTVSSGFRVSNGGVADPATQSNRLIVDHATAKISDNTVRFYMGVGGLLEVTDEGLFQTHWFATGSGAGPCRTFISNATLNVTWQYSTACAAGSDDQTEVVGPLGLLKAVKFRPGGNSAARATILARDGATVEGTSATEIGDTGPAALTISNATLKATGLKIGCGAGAAGSLLRFCGSKSVWPVSETMSIFSSGADPFGKAGNSRLEIAAGAQINPFYLKSGTDYFGTSLGTVSASNVWAVTGANTLYDADRSVLMVGCTTNSFSGNRFEVTDGATCNLRRVEIFGTNTFKVADATVNISYSDGYHTSIIVGTQGNTGGELVLSGAAPKIVFTDNGGTTFYHGGVKVWPGTRIVYELPATPYVTVPLDMYGLCIEPDKTHPELPLGKIDLDLSNIPEKHGRLVYKLVHVQEEAGKALTSSEAIARVNNLPEVKAIKGRLEWKGLDLVFIVPGNDRGFAIVFK